MRKIIIVPLFVFVLITSLISGCSSQESGVAEQPKEAAQQIVVDDSNDAESATVPEPEVVPTPTAPTITANPGSVSMLAAKKNCYPSYCTVFQNIIITSSTPWTSTPPGFGSLREGFVVSPDFGPAGSTTVAITYRYQIPEPNDGFIRFRTTTTCVYVEVPVILIAK